MAARDMLLESFKKKIIDKLAEKVDKLDIPESFIESKFNKIQSKLLQDLSDEVDKEFGLTDAIFQSCNLNDYIDETNKYSHKSSTINASKKSKSLSKSKTSKK